MLILSSCFILLINAVTFRRDKTLSHNRITSLILLYSTFLALNSLHMTCIETGIGVYGGLFLITSITQNFVVFILILSFLILQLISFYPRHLKDIQIDTRPIENKLKEIEKYALIGESRIIDFPLVILYILIGAVCLMSSCDLITMFLCLELQSYGLYILSTIYRDSELATSAGLTYFLLGGLSSCFILLGSALLYVNTGLTNFDGIYILYNLTDTMIAQAQGLPEYQVREIWMKSDEINPIQSFDISLLILSVGYLFKVSSAPFHFWSPDVYDCLPTLVTTFVAILAKISIFIFLLDFVHFASGAKTVFTWTDILLLSSFFSLIIGTVVGLVQTRIKRLFAYSTISHVGFILLALTINTIESTQAFIFYLMQYSLSNLNFFFILLSAGYYLFYYKGQYKLTDEINSPFDKLFKGKIIKLLGLLKALYTKPIFNKVSGWINHLCKVIIIKMIKRKIDNQGSKLIPYSCGIIKEQRADDYWCVDPKDLTHLRYALMGLEINHRLRMFSNHFNILRRSYSSLVTNPSYNPLSDLNPWFLTGFCDGESNFTVRISKSNSTKIGWAVQPVFQICLHKKDFNLLQKIQTFLGVGEIYDHKEESCNYVVQSLKGIKVIIEHFKRYPLLTKKREYYELFAQIVTLIEKKEHLTLSGIHEIISLKASMNLGLSSSLKAAFPDIIPAIRPKRSDEELFNSNIDPHWMVGFTAAEGCFSIRITEVKKNSKLGYQVQLRFNITQHSIDKVFIDSFVNFWECGKVYLRSKENKVDFQIIKFEDLCNKVVPLFHKIPLHGVKSEDFADFCKATKIMETKGHLTSEGLDELRKLKMGMNRGRK